ncbi:hypothetical protein NMYAN_100074 [Nitrosomonas nitrosa]|uniref:Uncharacterized protein n=1 Tax=Nitrosomonas nitrosa TaxID=52442 RepID=A0A8H9D7U8_9PROT|nr:hypothetical protein NMYAN_100074 [Nitrosomonas nitrosa]
MIESEFSEILIILKIKDAHTHARNKNHTKSTSNHGGQYAASLFTNNDRSKGNFRK